VSLKHTTVIFDLFGTLVNVFLASLHKVAVAEMADVLAIPLPTFAILFIAVKDICLTVPFLLFSNVAHAMVRSAAKLEMWDYIAMYPHL
jgi:hypothetical protein